MSLSHAKRLELRQASLSYSVEIMKTVLMNKHPRLLKNHFPMNPNGNQETTLERAISLKSEPIAKMAKGYSSSKDAIAML